ncbi:hypothetical protein GH714_039506 [Hevea brasiliensis]|uniref:Uncharacterized protein n=1 Tax=Hevea brasiliensis TaxID=3981 RepID=A0A6A6NKJ5_HEVBR|nr:hypothetical protein GH714_039506 [Hevea brasiliensis]
MMEEGEITMGVRDVRIEHNGEGYKSVYFGCGENGLGGLKGNEVNLDPSRQKPKDGEFFPFTRSNPIVGNMKEVPTSLDKECHTAVRKPPDDVRMVDENQLCHLEDDVDSKEEDSEGMEW